MARERARARAGSSGMVVVRKRRGAVVFAGTLRARSLSVEEIGDRKSEAPNFAIGDKCSVGLLVKKSFRGLSASIGPVRRRPTHRPRVLRNRLCTDLAGIVETNLASGPSRKLYSFQFSHGTRLNHPT